MKLYKLSQSCNKNYDTYDSIIVAAKTPQEAIMIHPFIESWDGEEQEQEDSWCAVTKISIEYLGEAAPMISKGVILASYNAG